MLKIDVVSHQGRPIADPISAVFNSAGGGIGRHPDSFLVLPDPQRHLSRRHAQISWRDNTYVIENTTSNNFVIVSGHTLHPNEFCTLQEGHQIYIGHYLLEVAALDASAGRVRTAPQPPVRIAPAATPQTRPQVASRAMPQASHQAKQQAVPKAVLQPPVQTPPVQTPPQTPSLQPQGISQIDAIWPDLQNQSGSILDDPLDPIHLHPQAVAEPLQDSFMEPRAEVPAAPIAPTKPDAHEHYDMREIGALNGHGARLGTSSILGDDDALAGPPGDDPFSILHAKSPAILPADPLIHPGELNLAHIEPERRAEAYADPFALPSLDLRNASDPLFDQSLQISLRDLIGQPKNIDDLYGDSSGNLPGLDPLAELEPVKALGTFEPNKSLDPLALFASESGTVQSLLDMTPSVVMDDHSDQLVMHLDLPRAVVEKADQDFMPAPDFDPMAVNERSYIPEAVATPAPAMTVSEPKQELKPVAPAQTVAAVPVAAVHAVPPANPAAPEPAAMDSDEHQRLIQAFLKSAGLPKEMVPQRLTPEFMEAVGAMLFTSMQGTVDLIAARAATKREVKAEMTLILPVHNNPLKFVPDGRAALIHMFGKQIPGFLGPIEAMKDAYQDLRAHQVGVFAGMRAALAEVLQRFSPDDVEKRLEQQSMIDSLMPGHRKAKLWDLYGQQFKKIYAEAQEDFDVIFGDAFAVAYEEQTRSMREDLASSKK